MTTLTLDDVTVHELPLPRPDMGGLDVARGELYVAAGMCVADQARLLERLAG